MKRVSVMSSSILAMVLAMPVAMAQDDASREQRQNQFMEQDQERQQQYMEKRQKRIEKHEERKEMYQNRLKEKQEDGSRMKGGAGGKR